MDESARRVHVSCSPRHTDLAQQIEARLRARQLHVDLLTESRQSASARAAVRERLLTCDGAVLVVDGQSIRSDWSSYERALLAVRRRRGEPVPVVVVGIDLTEDELVFWDEQLVDHPPFDVLAAPSPAPTDELAYMATLTLLAQLTTPADLVVIGRALDAPSLGRQLARLHAVEGYRFRRCWGSGTGGAPLALAAFLGAGEQLATLGAELRRLFAPGAVGRLRRARHGWAQPDDFVAARLVPAIAAAAGDDDPDGLATRPYRALGSPDHPADWLQLVILDLDTRRPALYPRCLDDMGRYSQVTPVADLLRAATAGFEGPPPLLVEDRSEQTHELCHYPAFAIPWSLSGEPDPRPVIVARPDATARDSSRLWGLQVDPRLVPPTPAGWTIVEVPALQGTAR